MSGSDYNDPDNFWSVIPSRTLVLICGYARAGKDTLANGILEWSSKNSTKVNFADELKDSANLWVDSIGLSEIGNFFNDEFKTKNRDLLVQLGVFARSHNQDIWSNFLCENIINSVDDDGIPYETIVTSDWRYLNELTCVQRNLIPSGWKIKTVYIETSGVKAANTEEQNSIDFIRKFVKFDYEFYYNEQCRNKVLADGKMLAKQWRL